MSSGTQVDLDWAGSPSPNDGYEELDGAGASPAHAPGGASAAKHLTDEEILGLEPLNTGARTSRPDIQSAARNPSPIADNGRDQNKRDSPGENRPPNDHAFSTTPGQTQEGLAHRGTEMPAWMAAVAADPRHSAEAQELWRTHQEFRAAFASPEEARAVKELLPGGVRDVLSLREATQSVDRIDAALFSGDARAQAEVVAEIARANPAAFRSLFAEAAKILAAGGSRHEGGRDSRDRDSRDDDRRSRGDDERHDRRHHSGSGGPPVSGPPASQGGSDPAPGDPDMSAGSAMNGRAASFDPTAYASFERATNDAVARDVRGSIQDTLARVMPEGVAEGAARRIGEDIFHEIHRALASDRTLSDQVAAVLRERRFGAAEQQRVASLLAARARQLVPSVARRVIGEWTSTVLNTARSKAARQAAAASRVDIAAPGGSLDSMPLRQMSPREVNYASMSDEEILGM